MKTTKKIVLSLVVSSALSVSAYGVCSSSIDFGTSTHSNLKMGSVINMNSHKITNVTDPSDDQDAATKKYVDDTIVGKMGFVADHEGWLHPTIKIGSQTWMADNMYVTSYNGSGDSAAAGDDIAAWNKALENTFSFPSDVDYSDGGSAVASDAIQRKMYGNFYQWGAAVDDADDSGVTPSVRGICPSGWHIPSNADWDALQAALGDSTTQDNTWANGQAKNIGTQLKAGGTSGFSAVMCGYRNANGAFYSRGTYTIFWASEQSGADDAWVRDLSSALAGMSRTTFNKSYGFSVRCIKD